MNVEVFLEENIVMPVMFKMHQKVKWINRWLEG